MSPVSPVLASRFFSTEPLGKPTGGSAFFSKNTLANAGHVGLTLGFGSFPGEGNGNLLQYAYRRNSINRGAWQAAVHMGHKRLKHN